MNKQQDGADIHGEQLHMPLVGSAGFSNYQVAGHIGWHQHQGFELTFVVKGSVTWEYENQVMCNLSGRQVSLTLPDALHRGINNVAYPCHCFWLVFDPTAEYALAYTTFTQTDLTFIANVMKQAGNSTVGITPFISSLLEEFRLALFSYQSGENDALILPSLRGIICQLILHSARCFYDLKPSSWSDDVQLAHAYISQHYREDLNVCDVASFVGKSETHLYNSFRHETGLTPSDLITRLRIDEACTQLRKTNKSVTQIALELGFCSSQYFSSVFKKYTGYSPDRFRKNG